MADSGLTGNTDIDVYAKSLRIDAVTGLGASATLLATDVESLNLRVTNGSAFLVNSHSLTVKALTNVIVGTVAITGVSMVSQSTS